jgi:uncharacterized membrane protein
MLGLNELLPVLGSVLLFLIYEARVLWLGHRQPYRTARTAHARMRINWVEALSAQPGFEIVAVQALRNSLMSATIAASTAALALMGTISLAGPTMARSVMHVGPEVAAAATTSRSLLEGLLMAVLFASYVCSAMAMRYFNHAGLVMSMPVASAARKALNPMASAYVERAGLLYSWGLRFFLMVAPVVVGIVNPWAMPLMTLLLIAVLAYFDRPHSGPEFIAPSSPI